MSDDGRILVETVPGGWTDAGGWTDVGEASLTKLRVMLWNDA